MTIRLPYKFDPRFYQLPLLQTVPAKKKRAVCVWHRRSGKDKTLLNLVVKEAHQRQGNYYYYFPTYKQGRRILWEGKDKTGMPFLDHIPPELIKRKLDNEMLIEFKIGSLFRVIGTDDVNSLVGPNPVGCVFSEYSLQDPRAWDFVRPILAENEGWAIFNYTPRGKNHGYTLYRMALENPEWFCQLLTVSDTQAIPIEVIAEEQASGMSEDFIMQEFYCSFEGFIHGSYYSKQIQKAYEENRITNVPYDENFPVDTWWDLGMNDSNAIWFTQDIGKEIRVIDYHEESGEGLQHYASVLQSKKYVYGQHTFPHDIEVRELGTGKSRKDVVKQLGITPLKVVERARDSVGVSEGIDATRRIFSRLWFDKTKCKRGIECLENYRKEYDEINKTFKNRPLHDWSSNGADAFRTFAMGHTLTDLRARIKDAGGQAPAYDPFAYMNT